MNKTTLLKETSRTMVALCAEAIKADRRVQEINIPCLGEMACLGLIPNMQSQVETFRTQDGKIEFSVVDQTMVGCYDTDKGQLVGAFDYKKLNGIDGLEMFRATLTRKSAQQLCATVGGCMGLSDYNRSENIAQMPLDRYQYLEAAVEELNQRLQTLQTLL